jgi:6-phosphofructo-2-kinase/fructose-2,6-biphosphatase 2
VMRPDHHRYAYFHHLPQEDLPYIKIPLHTVVKLTPKAYGCDEERYVFVIFLGHGGNGLWCRYALPIAAVDTHRPKPSTTAPIVQATTARKYFAEGND